MYIYIYRYIYVYIYIYIDIHAQRTCTRTASQLKARVGPSRYSEATTSHDAKWFDAK